MELIKITDKVLYFQGAANIGYILLSPDKGMLIDAGLEDQTMKKVIKQLIENNLPISHLFVTHAHADHYGGAAYLQKKHDVYTIAPTFEAEILQHPMIEPLYLFHGVNPMTEWRSKFLEGKPIRIDLTIEAEGEVNVDGATFQTLHLPGHSYNQYGVLYDGVLFAADSYFGIEPLQKHGIPYIVDAKQTIESLEKLKLLSCKGAIPGHGSFEKDFGLTVAENLNVHLKVEKTLQSLIQQYPGGIALEALVSQVCTRFDIVIKNVSSFMLFRTAVTAYLTKLIAEKKIQFAVKENQLLLESSSE